jgi:hypothetical protein
MCPERVSITHTRLLGKGNKLKELSSKTSRNPTNPTDITPSHYDVTYDPNQKLSVILIESKRNSS